MREKRGVVMAQTVKLAAILQLLGVFPLREICRKREGGGHPRALHSTTAAGQNRMGEGRIRGGDKGREEVRKGKVVKSWLSCTFTMHSSAFIFSFFFKRVTSGHYFACNKPHFLIYLVIRS